MLLTHLLYFCFPCCDDLLCAGTLAFACLGLVAELELWAWMSSSRPVMRDCTTTAEVFMYTCYSCSIERTVSLCCSHPPLSVSSAGVDRRVRGVRGNRTDFNDVIQLCR